MRKGYLLIMAVFLSLGAAGFDPLAAQPPETVTLPSPFTMQDGDKVETADQWRAQRQMLLKALLQYEYGTIPPPAKVEAGSVSPREIRYGDLYQYQRVGLKTGPEGNISITVEVNLPRNVARAKPIFVVGLNPVPLPEEMHAREFAFISYHTLDLDPDVEGQEVIGPAQEAYPDYTWGSLACWAWGASRVVDYCEREYRDRLDMRKSVITGHSRGGKTALLAGALDERFAVVVPNGSGAGGFPVYRVRSADSEPYEHLLDPFFYWFGKGFEKYQGRIDEMPFDNHWLTALVAPRGLCPTEARGDLWANPLGVQISTYATKPVYALFDAEDRLAVHYRDGEHNQIGEDYQALIDFADFCFGERSLPDGFNNFFYEGYVPRIEWSE